MHIHLHLFFSDAGTPIYSDKAFLFSIENKENKSYKLPIKGGMQAEAMYVQKDIGPLFGVNDIFLRSWIESPCFIQSSLGGAYKLPEDHGSESTYFLAGGWMTAFDEYEVFYEQ